MMALSACSWGARHCARYLSCTGPLKSCKKPYEVGGLTKAQRGLVAGSRMHGWGPSGVPALLSTPHIGLSSKTDIPAGLRLRGLSDRFVVSMGFLPRDCGNYSLAWLIRPFEFIQLHTVALRMGK